MREFSESRLLLEDVNVIICSSHSYIKIVYKENPIEMKNSAYWFKFLVIFIKENSIKMKNSAYWFKCTFISYYYTGIQLKSDKYAHPSSTQY